MPRRRKQDGFDALAQAFAAVPWWVPFLLAVVAWFGVPVAGAAMAPEKGWDSTWRLLAAVAALAFLTTGIAAQFEGAVAGA